MQNANQSEVARFREQLKAEYEAGQAALYGPSQGASTHLFLNNKTERMAVTIAEVRYPMDKSRGLSLVRRLRR